MVAKVPLIKASRPNRNRNAFDLSQRHMFTAHAGMLLPVLTLDLLPNDHVEIDARDFMRTLPMNMAAFVNMRGVYEFFAVPIHQIWPAFDQFITGMDDFTDISNATLNSRIAPISVPHFNLKQVFDRFEDEQNEGDILGYYSNASRRRLFDLLGYGRDTLSDGRLLGDFDGIGTNGSVVNIDKWSHINLDYNVSALRIAAYNKIYSDFYRDTTFESYNVGSFSLLSRLLDPAFFDGDFACVKWRNREKDYFSNVVPSMLFSMPAGLKGHATLGPSIGFHAIDSDAMDTYTYHDPVKWPTVSVASLRSAFAVDKLLSVTMRAGKTFADQMRAHYGVEIPQGRDGRVIYLGGFDSNFNVSDVDQTSATTQVGQFSHLGGYLGRSVSKAISSGSGHVEFDAKEHCILMCIYSLIPTVNYDSYRIDPMVSKINRFDYFTPEFENLGMQPLQSQFVSSFGKSVALGYQPRYSEYKTAVDVNHGQFNYKDSLSYFSPGHFRKLKSGLSKLTVDMLKINPNVLNDVFAVDYNGYENTDCVYGGCNFHITKISDMSVDGMPRV